MRIVTWNCAGKLDGKYEQLLSLRPDVAIIPECAEPDILRAKAPDFAFTDCEWQGELKDKGLGVFAFGQRSLRRHHSWDRKFQFFLPIELRGADSWNLLAVWAFNHRAPKSVVPNPPTTSHAVEYYAPFLRGGRGIVAGDFNANVIWDKETRYHKFALVDEALARLGLVSAHHAATRDAFGDEGQPTFWLQKKLKKTFHIDYVYVPKAKAGVGLKVSIGAADPWLKFSDHAPMVVDFD